MKLPTFVDGTQRIIWTYANLIVGIAAFCFAVAILYGLFGGWEDDA